MSFFTRLGLLNKQQMIHNRLTFMNKFVKSLTLTCRDIFIDSLIRILIDVHVKKDRNQKQIKRELIFCGTTEK